MKYIIRVSRLIAGATFIFSGLVKGVDPLGSMYKFIDYFTAFGLGSLDQFAFISGIVLAMAEFIIGICIITGLRYRQAAWGILLFMTVFTPLTLVLALTNPVSDCGCFGDAIKMTNWQTFFKNVFLLIFIIPLFTYRKRVSSSIPAIKEWIPVMAISLIFVFFSLYNYRHLPLIDFRPYKIGTNIIEGMTIPEDKSPDIYETKLIYEKDGRREKFTIDNYPSDDSTWIFIDQETVLVKKGYETPIHDFILSSPEGDDLTDQVLYNPGISLIMISKQLSEANQGHISKGLGAAAICSANGIDFYLLTSSSEDESRNLGSFLNLLFGDETMIKTIIRSNPGFIVIKEGTITAKWSGRDLPLQEDLLDEIEKSTENPVYNTNLRLFLLLSTVLLCTFGIAYFLRGKIKTKI